MTEAEWLSCTDTGMMIRELDPHNYDRKLRLFACACCRRIWSLLDDEQLRGLVELSERYADQEATHEQLRSGVTALRSIRASNFRATEAVEAAAAAYVASYVGSAESYTRAAVYAAGAVGIGAAAEGKVGAGRPTEEDKEVRTQRSLLLDIIGNPYRSVAADPAWQTSTVVALAQGIYAERAFDRLPILADALQDAGCEESTVLDHCRGEGLHVRGCWVVDLLLGKQ